MEHFPSVQRREDGAGEPACSTSPDGAASESTHKSGSGDGYIYHRVCNLRVFAHKIVTLGGNGVREHEHMLLTAYAMCAHACCCRR
jgi:hypothetical protein